MPEIFGENVGLKIDDVLKSRNHGDFELKKKLTLREKELIIKEQKIINEARINEIEKEMAELSEKAQQLSKHGDNDVRDKMGYLFDEYIRLAGPERARELREKCPSVPRNSELWRKILEVKDQWFPGEFVQDEFGEFYMKNAEEKEDYNNP